MKKIIEIKQNLLKALLATIGQNKICDSLASIRKTYDILERELNKRSPKLTKKNSSFLGEAYKKRNQQNMPRIF